MKSTTIARTAALGLVLAGAPGLSAGAATAAALQASSPVSVQVTQAKARVSESREDVVTTVYDLGDEAHKDPRTGTVSELRAVVHHPVEVDGRMPLIIQVHGSWWACTDADAMQWPCEKGEPFPSFRGYDYLGEELAARGFIVASISQDGINMVSFDYGDRARLINKHLKLWKRLDAGTGPLSETLGALTGHIGLRNVGTMGHSRGGKAVMWQASDKHRHQVPRGVRIKAVLPLAPVKFDHPEGDHSDTLVTRVPVGVVTSSCDGAVREQGQDYLDDAQEAGTRFPAYSVSIKNANHNYYNTEWTPPGDLTDDDSRCKDRELSPQRQQQALVQYATAFYERFLNDDRRFEKVLNGKIPLAGVRSVTRKVAATSPSRRRPAA